MSYATSHQSTALEVVSDIGGATNMTSYQSQLRLAKMARQTPRLGVKGAVQIVALGAVIGSIMGMAV